MAKKKKLRVVSVNPTVLSTRPAPHQVVEVTLRFEVEDENEYEGVGLLIEWINGTFDNGDYSEDVGYPPGLGQPMVVTVIER